MKRSSHNKVVGLSLGERSLLAAEVIGGERPAVRKVAEFVYPEGASVNEPAALGAALAAFLSSQGFTAKAAVVGLPARWLVVKTKEVPPSDPATLAEMLRLQAEGEFSSELKDLVYDYAGGGSGGGPGAAAGGAADAEVAAADDGASPLATSVLLVATPRRYLDAAAALCDAARLSLVSVTSSAAALGAAAARGGAVDSVVLSAGTAGVEMAAQNAGGTGAIRHLRGPGPERAFVGELRRALSSVPGNGAARELILWDAGELNAKSLGEDLGLPARSGELSSLGVDADEVGRNGAGRRFGSAVALALTALPEAPPPPLDFLHSRLTAPPVRRIPRWAWAAAAGAVVLGGLGYWAVNDLGAQQRELDDQAAKVALLQKSEPAARAYVDMVSFAQGWHGGKPRYLACLRDLTNAVPEDGQTFATSLIVREAPKPTAVAGSKATTKPGDGQSLVCVLSGKSSDQGKVQALSNRLLKVPTFTDANVAGSTESSGRGRAGEVTFSITFNYVPPPAPPPARAKGTAPAKSASSAGGAAASDGAPPLAAVPVGAASLASPSSR